MFKFSSKASKLIALFFILFGFSPSWAGYDLTKVAVVEEFVDENKIVATSLQDDWVVGEILAVISKNPKLGVIGFLEVDAVDIRSEDKYELKLSLQRQSRKFFIQKGDFIRRLDLSTENEDYVGTTDLIIRNSQMNISSKYRPLVYQGFVIGDTAQTLFEKEFLINYFGNIYYGFRDWLTIGTLAPVNLLGRPNFNFRAKLIDSDSTTISSGLSFTRLVKENQASVNLNLYWDSTSTDSLISHTYIRLGLVNIDNSEEVAAVKYLTSSSFQTGYEIILDNWDRFLVGPSYNFEKKALGGYMSYVWMMDRFHLQLSINATDVSHLRLDPTDGYYGFFDIFWRF